MEKTIAFYNIQILVGVEHSFDRSVIRMPIFKVIEYYCRKHLLDL